MIFTCANTCTMKCGHHFSKTSHWIDKFWRSFEIKNDFRNENLLSHILKWTPLRNLVSCPVHIREFCEDYQKSHRAWLHCRHPVWLLPYREIQLSARPSVSNRATRDDKYTIRYIFWTKINRLKVSKSLCAGMEILAWFLLEGKYYSHTWFLYTTGLRRYQGPPEK